MKNTLTLLLLLIQLFPLSAQISFSNQTFLLSDPFGRSGAPMAICDMNGDGLDDIIRLKSTTQLQILYQPTAGIVFSSLEVGTFPSAQWSICIADVDRNGFNDIFSGGAYNGLSLYKAVDNGLSYSDTLLIDPPLFLQGSNFVDIDGDLDVDIFACHDDGLSAPQENDGLGNFTTNYDLILAESYQPSDNSGNYGSVWIDYDNDRDLDLYLSKCRLGVQNPNDPRRVNLLFQNDGSGNYENVAFDAGLVPYGQSWAADFADIDNDGDLDCFVINHDIPNNLYINDGTGVFEDVYETSGMADALEAAGDGIQVKFADFDNDGFVDLLFTSRQANHCLFKNNGDQTFTKVPNPFAGVTERIHSAVTGDLNNDGFLDVYAGFGSGFNGTGNIPDQLFFNEGNDNHYFQILLEGTISNPNGIGARVEIHGDWGKQIREVRSGESYGITNSMINHFGLGTSTQVDSVVIYWPSGLTDHLINPPIDTFYQFTEGSTCITNAAFSFSSSELEVAFTDLTTPGATAWVWQFGDGSFSTEQNPTHTYAQAGVYEVCLSVGGFCQPAQKCLGVSVACEQPQTIFTLDSDQLSVQFTDLSQNTPDEWLWTFGDGNSSTEQNPLHTYDASGEYFVCLISTSLCGQNEFCETITVGCNAPNAAFDVAVDELAISLQDNSTFGVQSWLWDFGDGNGSQEQNPDHLFSTPGTYQVCLTVIDDCGSDISCELVDVSCPAPQANFDYVNDDLAYAFQNLATNANTFFWTFGDGDTAIIANPLHEYEMPGVYEVCQTVGNICGTTTSCQTVSVSCPAPIAAFESTFDELVYQFTDVSENTPETWDWTFGDGNFSSEQNPEHAYAIPGTYEVCLNTSSICGDSQSCQMIEVSCTAPQALFGFIPEDLFVNFVDFSMPEAETWFWTFGDGQTSEERNPDYTYAMPGTYEVCLTATSLCGSTTYCENINLNCPAPLAQFTFSTGDDLQVEFADESLGEIDAWLWNFGDGNNSNEQNPTHVFTSPGTYAVCLEITNVCGSNQVCQLLEVSCPPPESAFNFISSELNYAFIDQSINNPSTWSWDFGNGDSSSEQNPIYSFPLPGNFEVCLTTASICGETTFCQMLEVNCIAPNANFDVMQDGLFVQFSDSSDNNPTNWEWTFGNGDSSSDQNPLFTFDAPGNYLVCLTASSVCGEDQHCQQIELSCAAPEAQFEFSNDELSYAFSDSSTNGATNWIWDFDDGTNSNLQNPVHDFSEPGVYEVCLTASSICGSTQICQMLTVSCNAPQATFSWLADDLSFQFVDASTNVPLTWLWTFGDGNTSAIQSPAHVYNQPGTYEVCLTVSSICGETISCQNIEVSCQAPQADFNLLQNELTIILFDNSDGNPNNWLWTFGDGSSLEASSPTYTYEEPGSYELCLTVTNECGTTQTCQQIEVSCTAPEAQFAFNQNELNIHFNDQSANNPTTWLWSFGDGTTSEEQNPAHSYEVPGTYEVCLEVNSICGMTITCSTLDIECTAPNAQFSSQADQLNLQFVDNSDNAPTTWLWDFGDGNGSDEQNPQHSYEFPGLYTVCLEVSSICGETQICEEIIVSCIAPQADFDYASSDLEFAFSDNSMDNPVSWFWSFGDGTTSDEQNPTHFYTNPGNYLVCLQVENVCGNTQRCELVEVSCTPAGASFTSEIMNLDVQFFENSDPEVEAWLWDFGDGQTSTQMNPAHVYANPGDYEVCLTVLSLCGDSTLCDSITVECEKPNAGFSFLLDANTIQLQDQSTNSPTEWLWDFGDGTTSTEQNPMHIYTTIGNYEVCLIASSVCGMDTVCNAIDVLVGIEELKREELEVYPNPANTHLIIDWEQTALVRPAIRLWSALGTLCLEANTAQLHDHKLELDTQMLPNGTYWLILESESRRRVEKVIILH